MSDLKKYIEERKKNDPEFCKDFELEYESFKIGVFLKQARKSKDLTREEMARKMKTKKSVISRIENFSRDIRLSALNKYALATGNKVSIVFKKDKD